MGDWAFHFLAGLLAVLSICLFAWGWFADRARGRKRCPRCWYDMSAAVALTCPECGKVAKRPSALQKTRHRWWVCALAAAGLVCVWPVAQGPMIRTYGWPILIPDSVLIECLPLGGKDGFIGTEIQRRTRLVLWPDGASTETWTDKTYTAFFRRCLRGNGLARPIDENWKKSYGELLRQIYRRFSYDPVTGRPTTRFPSATVSKELADAIEALNSLPTEMPVSTRSKWPRSVRPMIAAPVANWCAKPFWFEQEATLITNAGAPTKVGFVGNFDFKYQGDAHAKVEIDVDLFRTVANKRKPGEAPIKRVHAVLEFDIVETIDDAMEPVQSAEIGAAMAAIVVHIRRGMLELDHRLPEKLPAEVGIGLSYELRADGTIIENGYVRCVGGVFGWTMGSITNPAKAPPRDKWDPKAVWTLNLKTDPAWSLYNISATKYWKGEVTVPVTFVP